MRRGFVDSQNPISDHPLNEWLGAWWVPTRYSQGGSWLRDATSRNSAALTGGYSWVPAPDQAAAVKFNGSTAYGQAPSTASLSPPGPGLGVAAWVRLDATGQRHHIVAKYTGNATLSYDFFVENTNRLILGMSATGNDGAGYRSATGATTLVAGRWYFLAGTSDGTNIRVYVDGTEDGSGAAPATIFQGTQFVRIGNLEYGGVNIQYANAAYAAIWLYPYTLSPAQIAGLRDQTRRGYPDLLNYVTRRTYAFDQAAPPAGGQYFDPSSARASQIVSCGVL